MAEENDTSKSPRLIDLTGKRFGRLAVLGYVPNPGGVGKWECKCDCGAIKQIASSGLRRGNINSCGCLRKELLRESNRTHGMGKAGDRPSEYSTWSGMLSRCRNPKTTGFHRYGGRGIVVCERWLSFENFLADMGRKPSANHTIERVDNDGPYSPDNCRWVPACEQQKNTGRTHFLTHNGQTLCIVDWAKIVGVTDNAIHSRLKRGWSIERALSK